jgi:uncharacterized protein (TIGR02231 family)
MIKYFYSILCMLAINHSYAQKQNVYKAALQKATVYLQGAEMEHIVKATVNAGNTEIFIENVADVIDENSIQVGADVNVNILSASLTKDFEEDKPLSTGSVTIKKQLDIAIFERKKIVAQKQSEEAILQLLEANKAIGGSNTGVNLTELMKTADYVRAKTLEVSNNLLLIEEKIRIQNELVSKLQQQYNESTGVSNKVKGRIVLQVNSTTTQQVQFSINYITQQAWWKPMYDLKVGGSNKNIKLIYKAELHQSTGIVWDKVKITLASSLPNQYGTAPLLTAWYLRYRQALDEVVVVGYGTKDMRNNTYGNSLSNTLDFKLSGRVPGVNIGGDFNKYKKDDKALTDYTTVQQNLVFVSFDIDLPYTIPSDGKAYSISMKDYDLPASFKHYAVPKLDKDAYLLAQITNWEDLSLLPGEANIILEGAYVGKTVLDVTNSDTLNISMGRDKRLVVKREKVTDYSSKKFLANNKTQKFTYEITVRNTNNEMVKAHIKDQIPLTSDKNIEISLEDNGGAELNEELGVLNWMIELKPKETRKLRFTYTVKYPKDKVLDNL